MNTWRLPTFRVGQGNYEVLNESPPQEEEAQQARTEGETEGDGRGEATLDRAPKPTPGDELYDTIHRAGSDSTERPPQQQDRDGYLSAVEFAALIELTTSNDQQRPDDQPAPAWQQQDAAQEQVRHQAPEAAQQPPEQAQQQEAGRGGFAAMRADQAAAEIDQPQPRLQGQEQESRDGLMRDFVTAETQATAEAERSQDQQQQRTRHMSLAM